MSGKTVIVVASGDGPAVGPFDPAVVVAADGGLERAQALGLEVAVAIGDFDSVDPAMLAAAEAGGTTVMRFPAAKDATDLELALDHAATLQPGHLVVILSGGGRLDHLLAACLALASPSLAGTVVDAHVGQALVHVIRGRRTLSGEVGETLTLLPVGGPAVGVRTEGLAYALHGETLAAASSRGVSNVFATCEATVSVEQGILLAVRPGPVDEGGRG